VHEPCHVVDILPTCLAAAGVDYPQQRRGNRLPPLEGQSILSLVDGAVWEQRDLYWEHEGNRAMRRGDWKLVSRGSGRWELYNMARDRTELADLAESEHKRVDTMAEAWGRWAKRTGVLPWPVGRR
jgi:arylsulfatase